MLPSRGRLGMGAWHARAGVMEFSDCQARLVKRHFDAHAAHWDHVYSRERDVASKTIRQRLQRVLQFVDVVHPQSHANVLDLGCGAGHGVAALARRGHFVVGIDPSEEMINRARALSVDEGWARNVEYLVGNAYEIDYADHTFDVVIAMGLIEYLTFDRWALQEMARVVKPRGHLLVTVPNQSRLTDRVNRRWTKLEDRISYFAGKLGGKKTQSSGMSATGRSSAKPSSSPGFERRLYRLPELCQMLNRLGLDVIDGVTHGFGPFGPFDRHSPLSRAVDDTLERCRRVGWFETLAGAGNNAVVVCQKADLQRSAEARARLMDTTSRVEAFEREHRDKLRQRDLWVEVHRQSTKRIWDESQDVAHRVLVLSPHPDDEIIGCGGILAKLVAAGSEVTVLHLTDGRKSSGLKDAPPGDKPRVRLVEARHVAEEMGFHELVAWSIPEGKPIHTAGNVEKLQLLLGRIRPDLIFTPFVDDPHVDHQSTSRLLAEALGDGARPLGGSRIYSYEVWGLVPVSVACPIDDVWQTKSRMLMRYRTAMKATDCVDHCYVRGAFHARWQLDHGELAEVFHDSNPETFIRLVQKSGSDNFVLTLQPESKQIASVTP